MKTVRPVTPRSNDRGTSRRAGVRVAVALIATGVVMACLTVPASADPLASPSVTSTTGAPSGTGATTTPTASTTTTTTGGGGSGGGNVLIPNRSIAHAGTALNGAGSSFAAPAIETFQQVVQNPPYGLTINYTSTSSGDGRYEFTNGTTDFAVSDIAYGLGGTDSSPPTFPYIYVPITAGGIAFMYNVPGLSKNLQLSSYSTCGILTGGITNWNDSNIAKDNPGLSLPNLPIVPVTESDPAGTNYVLEEWCIAEQPALWAAFANKENANNPPVVINATSPQSEWPPLANGRDTTSTAAVTGNVSTTAGAIGGVQLKYANDAGFGTGDPSKGVASELNASNSYAQPSSVDVASALAYATQLPNGTHQLNFNGVGVHVYNPSTYSYLLSPAAGWSAAKGATMSAFVNYTLTLGQQKSPSFGYASLGLSLERWGITEVTQDVPGAVAVTDAEKAAYACGDLTPGEVAAGQTTPTCGVLDPGSTPPIPPPSGAGSPSASAAAAAAARTAAAAGHSGGAGGGSGGGSGSGSGSGAGGVDPSVSLSGSGPLAFTGGDPRPVVLVGLILLVAGWATRRRLLRKRRMRGAQ